MASVASSLDVLEERIWQGPDTFTSDFAAIVRSTVESMLKTTSIGFSVQDSRALAQIKELKERIPAEIKEAIASQSATSPDLTELNNKVNRYVKKLEGFLDWRQKNLVPFVTNLDKRIEQLEAIPSNDSIKTTFDEQVEKMNVMNDEFRIYKKKNKAFIQKQTFEIINDYINKIVSDIKGVPDYINKLAIIAYIEQHIPKKLSEMSNQFLSRIEDIEKYLNQQNKINEETKQKLAIVAKYNPTEIDDKQSEQDIHIELLEDKLNKLKDDIVNIASALEELKPKQKKGWFG
jgi:hypothetical protein